MIKKINSNLLFNFILGIILVFSFCKILQTNYLSFVTNNFCDDNTYYFKIKDISNVSYFDLCSKGDMLQAQLNSNCFAIYYNEDLSVPLLSGDFFHNRSHDFKNIVLGKNYISKIKYIDGMPFFDFNNSSFYVCGIIGLEFPTSLDKNIYFYLPEIPEWISSETIFSTSDKGIINFKDIEFLDKPLINYENLFSINIYIFIFIFFLMGMLLIIYFQIEELCLNEVQTIDLMIIFGHSKKSMLAFLIMKYLILNFSGIIIGSIVAYILWYKSYYNFPIISSAMFVITTLLFIFVCFYVKLTQKLGRI